jgi:hypothetical protein
MVHHGVVHLPKWCVMEGSLGIVAISKGNVFEGYQPLVYVSFWEPVVPGSVGVFHPARFILIKVNVITN